jgi:RTX calcium-binding nonapeptide repeat (4 copies)
VDASADGPNEPEGFRPEAWPLLPEPPPSVPEPPKRHRGLVMGLLVGAGTTFIALSVIGILVSRSESELPFEEHFSSNEPKFTTDSDPMVDFSVADGAYHILIKDASAPQVARHIFAHTYDGIRFEAAVALPGSPSVLLAVGCWSGDHAYLFALLGDGEVGLIETVSEFTGEWRALTEGLTSDAVGPVSEPNRLRIDCVGGGTEPTVVSGWINGEPILSVAIRDGYDSFDAVGLFVGALNDGAEFVVDNVAAAAERPNPARSPVPPIESPVAPIPSPRPPNQSPGGPIEVGKVKCQGEKATIIGTSGDDELTGTFGSDVIAGLGGNDAIRAGDGSDTVCGGPGDDRIYGSWGDDSIDGNSGNDEINGVYGGDTIDGGSGSDTLIGSGGTDTCDGGERNSSCEVVRVGTA